MKAQADTLQILTGNVPRPCVIRNAYYKHEVGEDGKPRQFMSGLPLPLDANGRLDGITFVHCYFHPCCPDVRKLGGTIEGVENRGFPDIYLPVRLYGKAGAQ